MIKKRLLCLGLILTLSTCLVGCGEKEDKKANDTSVATEKTTTKQPVSKVPVTETPATEAPTTNPPTTAPPTEVPTEPPTKEPDKISSVYASTKIEGENIICKSYAPYSFEDTYYDLSAHNIWEKYREIVDSLEIKGKYIEPVSNHYIVYEPFDMSSVDWIKFEFSTVEEGDWEAWYDEQEAPSYYTYINDGVERDLPLYLYSYNDNYEARYRELYTDNNFISKFFSDSNINRIGITVLVKFKPNSTKEQTISDLNKIESLIRSFNWHSDITMDK